MTTIAYRDGVLAADSAMCRGGTHMCGIAKIVRREDGAMAAVVGVASLAGPFFRWFLDGEKGDRPTVPDDGDICSTGFIVRPGGVIEMYEHEGWYDIQPEPYFAVGSGRDVALGAMVAGADAEVAVRAAIAHDQGTGGDITVLRREG